MDDFTEEDELAPEKAPENDLFLGIEDELGEPVEKEEDELDAFGMHIEEEEEEGLL